MLKLHQVIKKILHSKHNHYSTRTIADLLGILVSCCVAVHFGFVYTKVLEREKTNALSVAKGNYGGYMTLSDAAFSDLQ